jgi:DNA-3-methyladenine glycosylase
VARELIGCRLIRILDGQRLSGIISETEAYIGEDDRACHAAVGRTQRNVMMYGPAGHAYVYLIYGIHHCFNVVTEAEGFPAAVLVRGVQPAEGIERMGRPSRGRPLKALTNGPGKLCQAFAIDLSLNGVDLVTGEAIFIEPGDPIDERRILTTPRIGVTGDNIAINVPWRFVMTTDPN